MCGTSNILWQNNLLPRKYQWEIFTNILATFMKCCGRLKHGWLPGEKSGGFWNRNSTAPWFATVCARRVPPSVTVANINFFRVVRTFWSWGKELPIPDCYSRWNLSPPFWIGDEKAIHGMAPPSSPWKKNIQNPPSVSKVMITVLLDSEE